MVKEDLDNLKTPEAPKTQELVLATSYTMPRKKNSNSNANGDNKTFNNDPHKLSLCCVLGSWSLGSLPALRVGRSRGKSTLGAAAPIAAGGTARTGCYWARSTGGAPRDFGLRVLISEPPCHLYV